MRSPFIPERLFLGHCTGDRPVASGDDFAQRVKPRRVHEQIRLRSVRLPHPALAVFKACIIEKMEDSLDLAESPMVLHVPEVYEP